MTGQWRPVDGVEGVEYLCRPTEDDILLRVGGERGVTFPDPEVWKLVCSDGLRYNDAILVVARKAGQS